jgi:type VI secretion system secreted protein VgrG
MTEVTQANRTLQVHTALGEDALFVHAFAGEEGMSRPFRFQLELSAEAGTSPDAAALLGSPACVSLQLASGETRLVHGLISRFRRMSGGQVLDGYQAELVPWLWMLSLSTDCVVYQQLSVPEIVQAVFKEHGYTDFRLALTKSYAPREYCVQYRETHLAFVQRLLEDEGIFYYFEHAEDKHTLVLADNAASARPCPNAPVVRPAPSAGGWSFAEAAYAQLTVERAVHTRKVALTDYNYLTPSTDLGAKDEGKSGQGEAFDYPGGYMQPDEGSRYARLRLEEAEALAETARGDSTAAALTPGYKVTLEGSGPTGGDRDWLLLSIAHQARQGSFVSGDEQAFTYENSFTAVPLGTAWRPSRATPRPRIRGTQSALVVGKAGEEIHTDAHGRVKLQFYWDRRGKRDENSSCWVRCSTAWAGKGWGQFSVPRIGQEVLVDFLEGDPDRPIVVGRVYNAEQPPPCNPAGGGAVSGMRSKTHKGSGYNAMEMDDTAGKEKISVHAQYDMDTTVQHDDTQTVVSGNRTITVKTGTHTETIKGNTSITIQTGNHSLNVQAGSASVHVAKAVTETFDDSQSTTVKLNVTINGGEQILLQSGSSAITLIKDGTIKIHCKKLEIIGDAEIKASAPKVEVMGGDDAKFGVGGQNIMCDKAKTSVSGTAINATATGTHEIVGALVKIN